MKKYQILGLAAMTTFAIVGAQNGPGMPPPPMMGSASVEMRASTTIERPRIMPPLRQDIKDDRREMRDQNREDRKDFRMETREQMKNASSSDERRAIMEDARGRREDMHASNTVERKEINERSKELAKNKISQTVERLKMVTEHLENALIRTEKFITDKRASSTADMTSINTLLAKAKTSLVNVKNGIAGIEASVSASTTLTVENKDSIKSSVKAVQDNIKTFQDDLKNLLNALKIRNNQGWDLKANK